MPGNNYLYSTGEFLMDSPEIPSSQPVNLPALPALPALPTFDPNAGRQEAYDKRWNAYLLNLGQTQNKINVKKARKSFDQQFNQDWNNEVASRQIDFVSQLAKQKQQSIIDKWRADRAEADRLSLELDARDYEAAGYTFDINKGWTKPEIKQDPAPKAFNEKHWLGRAKQFGFNSIDEVKAWQKQNGLAVDGMFGGNSEAKWNELNLQKPLIEDANPYAGRDDRTITRDALQQAASVYKKSATTDNNVTSKVETPKIESDAKVQVATNPFGNPIYKYDWSLNGFVKAWNAISNFFSRDPRFTDATKGLPALVQNTVATYGAYKNGGNINKFSNGGNMNEQQMQEAFVTFLIQDAQAQGINIQSEEDMKAYIQQLGLEGLAAKQQEFMQKMQGTPSRRLGGHLQYLNKLKGNCQEGEELVYMKEGGRVCPKCIKKAEGGTKTSEEKKRQNTVKQWKADRAKAKDEAARDSVAINKYNDQETMVNKGHKGKFKNGVWTPNRKEYTKKNACGAKMKEK